MGEFGRIVGGYLGLGSPWATRPMGRYSGRARASS